MDTFVIGEAGSTHDGELAKALRLVELGAQIGVDAVKFQWVSSAERLVERRNALSYLDAYRVIQFPRDWHPVLEAACVANDMEYMCTVYLPEDIAVIEPFVRRFKVSSFEAGSNEFIRSHQPYRKPMIISCGVGGPEEDLVEYVELSTRYLHCVSAYPTPVDQINLSRIRAGYYDGLSDHTHHPWTGGLAVAAGATIIEFHYRLGDSRPRGADYTVARDPGQASDYVKNIRLAEVMMGSEDAKVQPCEREMLRYRVRA